MTKRIARLALAGGVAAALVAPGTASAIPRCTDRPVEDCIAEVLEVFES